MPNGIKTEKTELDKILEAGRKFRERVEETMLRNILSKHFDVKPDEPYLLSGKRAQAFGYFPEIPKAEIENWQLKMVRLPGEIEGDYIYQTSAITPEGWEIVGGQGKEGEEDYIPPEVITPTGEYQPFETYEQFLKEQFEAGQKEKFAPLEPYKTAEDKYNIRELIEAGISEELLIEAFGEEAYQEALKAPVEAVTAPQGFIWDFETGRYTPATLDIEVTKKFYKEHPELLPEGISPALTPAEAEELVAELRVRQEETTRAFVNVFPELEPAEGQTYDELVAETLTYVTVNEEIKDWFTSGLLEKGRTPETERLLEQFNFTEKDITEFFAEPLTGKTPEAVLELEPEWQNTRTGEVITASELEGRFPKGYEAELDKWVLTRETALNYGSVFKVFGEALTKLPKQLGAAILQAYQGQGGASVVDRDWADQFIEDAKTDQAQFVQEVSEKYGKTRLPIQLTDLAELPQNIAFSLTSMGAALGVGVPIALLPVPGARVAAWLTGSAVSGAVAYNMTTYQIMQEYLEAKNDEMQAALGRGLTAEEEQQLKQDFSRKAHAYGLWEAVPEAVSNLAFGKILTSPLTKIVGRNIASRIIGKLGLIYGEEFLTETITQKGQSDIEVEAGLREGRISWIEAFKEIAPQTFLLTTVLGGAGQIGVSFVNKIKQSLKKEVGESPVYESIKENITKDIFADIEANAQEEFEATRREVEVTPVISEVTEPLPLFTKEVTKRILKQGRQADLAIRLGWLDKEGQLTELGKLMLDEPLSNLSPNIKELAIQLRQAVEAIPKLPVAIPKVEPEAVTPTITETTPTAPKFATNIRLEKYSEEVQPMITEWAETHQKEVQEARRGVISDEQVRTEAERLTQEVGGDLDKMRKRWKPGVAWNAEELVAIRSILQEKTKAVIAAQKTAKENNSTQNLLKLEIALREQAAVQEQVHGLTAEAGRALRSFRQNVLDAIASNDTARMEEILKKLGGRENIERVTQLLSQIDINDPIAVNKFIQSLNKPVLMDYLIELFYNSILSGPKTHIVNSLSNMANAIFSPVERMVSALVDMPLAKIQGRTQERYLGEVEADIFGAIRGIPEGFRQFAYVIKNGISFDQATKWEFRQKAFKGKGGAIINLPSRFLEGADMLMKAINQRAALNALAYRIAKKEGLKGQAFENRVAELLSNPTLEMLKEANKVAEYRLFRQPPGKFGQTLMDGRDAVDFMGIKPLRFVMPFLRTPINLVKFGLERTPLGFINAIRTAKREGAFTPEVSDQIARAMIGSMGLAALSFYFVQGMITGAPPRDRAERDRFYREGKQPYAIRVDGFWVSYQRLEPFNQLLSMVAMIAQAIEENDKDVEEKIWDAVNTFGQNFISQTYMSSVSDLIEMLAQPERYAGRWFNRFASSMAVPFSSATRTAAQMLDRTVRDPQTAWETIEANIPGLSNKVKAKLTALGEDIERKSFPWFPVNVTPVEETILSQELERLEYDIGFVGKTISGIELTDDEQYEYLKLAGQLTKQDLEKLMLAPDYWTASDIDKNKMIAKVVDTARDWARMKMREKMWTVGATEERMKVLETALAEVDSQLGKVISATPEFTHEEANVYDLSIEMDNSYRSLLGDIPEEALKGIKVPATVTSWYAKNRIVEETSSMLSKALISLSAKEGTTFEDYYNQWQQRSKITDERELAEFDKKYPNANLGNMSKRQLEILRGFHKTPAAQQAKFLASLTEEDRNSILNNSYKEYMETHPKENAELAIWGEAKLLTAEAYDEFNKLVRQLDIPDSALPKKIIPENLPVFLIETEKQYRELSNKYEATQYLDDTIKDENGLTARAKARAELKVIPISGIKIGDIPLEDATFGDVSNVILAMGKGTTDDPIPVEIIDLYVAHKRIADETSGGSLEVKLNRYDNLGLNAFLMNKDYWVQPAEPLYGEYDQAYLDNWLVPRWRLVVQYRKETDEYEAILEKYKGKEEDAQIRNYLYKDGRPTEYQIARYQIKAYEEEIPFEYQNDYIKWYTDLRLTEKPDDYPEEVTYYEDDWFLMEHEEFEDFMVQLYKDTDGKDGWKEKRDFSKVPTRQVLNEYLEYLDEVEGKPRVDYRAGHLKLDAWLLLTGKVSISITEKRRRAKLSEAEKAKEELKDISELLKR